jgi:hypothetical protein
MARTVTQLTSCTDNNGDVVLIAVCSDGTMWTKAKFGKTVIHQPGLSEQPWVSVSNVPQT